MKKNAEQFHNKHELLTDVAYNSRDMLPARYVFVLTTLCNMNCSFCFQNKEPHSNSMSKDDWLRLAKQLPEYGRVTMTGGEPFLFPGFKEVFDFIAERFECNIITNGLLLTEDLIDHILSYPKFRVLSVSIDNVGNTIRNVRPSRWKKVEGMMRYFARRRNDIHPECILDAKTTVLDENANELFEIHEYCVEELSCDNHSFQFLKGSPIQHADMMYPFEDVLQESRAPIYKNFEIIREQLENVRQYNLKGGRKAFLHPKVASLNTETPLPAIDCLNQPYHIKENFEPCRYPWSSVHINADGNLFPCLAVFMGDVRQTPLEEIIWGESFTRFRNLINREGTVHACSRCGWLRPRNPERT